ncbi:hypothetical protein BDN72DRAFT_900535 [Pluteus cervinus]|uniref:Uncharacterized protein n=1 Tax=Pluteus cervinus TaxID=181527 RepID=A0ACD3AIT7_9AGAR|nr:hypothetical protein BDN72DRAFT_900535 [Pluteus cervinus]
MAPAVAWRTGSAPRSQTVRDGTLNACTAAAAHADFAGFDTMEIWNGAHTSRSDAVPHGSVRVKTLVQIGDGTHQVAHIYFDASYNYIGHNLYPNIKAD